MDNRLILVVLLVTLSWLSVGTYADTNSTSTTNSTTSTNGTTTNSTTSTNGTTTNSTTSTNGTTTNSTTSTNGTTTNSTTSTNGTTTNSTTSTNGTTTNSTTSTNGTTTNSTTSTNGTTTNSTTSTNGTTTNSTTSTNGTTTNSTTSTNGTTTNSTTSTNGTTTNSTTSTNGTTTSTNGTTNGTTGTTNTTTTPPLVTNTTVETLETNISNTECGNTSLCASEPASCDPSSGSCFFLSAKQQAGDNFEFGLAGESSGYIAATLSTDTTLGGNDTTYVCANKNGVVKFFGAVLDNDVLTPQEQTVTSVKGKVNGNKIQCTFLATAPSSSTRTSNLALAISTGPFNATTDSLGAPTSQVKTGLVNLANPSANVTNELTTNTTSSPNTTSNAVLHQSLMPALLVSAGVVGLTLL